MTPGQPAVGTLSDLVSRSRLAAALSVGLLGAAAISAHAAASTDTPIRPSGTLLRPSGDLG